MADFPVLPVKNSVFSKPNNIELEQYKTTLRSVAKLNPFVEDKHLELIHELLDKYSFVLSPENVLEEFTYPLFYRLKNWQVAPQPEEPLPAMVEEVAIEKSGPDWDLGDTANSSGKLIDEEKDKVSAVPQKEQDTLLVRMETKDVSKEEEVHGNIIRLKMIDTAAGNRQYMHNVDHDKMVIKWGEL